MKAFKLFILFPAGAWLAYMGAFNPWHELGHIIKSTERGGHVLWLEWSRVALTYVDADVYLFGYGWTFLSFFFIMLVLGAVGWNYKWSWPAWGFVFGMLHGTYLQGRGATDFFEAARLSRLPLAEVAGYWDKMSAGFLGMTWAVILIVWGYHGLKKASAPRNERGFSRVR